jgi:hypothetical protein
MLLLKGMWTRIAFASPHLTWLSPTKTHNKWLVV